MTFNTIKQAIYGLYLTNSFGYRLRKANDPMEKKRLRLAYSEAQLDIFAYFSEDRKPRTITSKGSVSYRDQS